MKKPHIRLHFSAVAGYWCEVAAGHLRISTRVWADTDSAQALQIARSAFYWW